MSNWNNESEAREQIKALVAEYYNDFKKPEQDKEFTPGDRISYASRVYDEKEMMALTDCLLYTSPSPRDRRTSRMASSA